MGTFIAGATVRRWRGNEGFPGRLFLHLVNDARFRRHDKGRIRALLGVF